MNFLAHCLLAQPNGHSLFGNLLGDFTRGADLDNLPEAVLLGLKNHQEVDRFTDTHPTIKDIRAVTSKERRRFAGIMGDVVYDYFLIKHWEQYTDHNFNEFIELCYKEIESAQHLMHPRMHDAMSFMINSDGLRINSSLEGVGKTLDRISQKIRFKNSFMGSIEEIHTHIDLYEKSFLKLFPELLKHIQDEAIEQVSSK